MAAVFAHTTRAAKPTLAVVTISAYSGYTPQADATVPTDRTGTGLEATPSSIARSRAPAIPAGPVRMSPETDPSPPVVYSDEWLAPAPMPGPIDTAATEDSPFVTTAGETSLFFFTPDVRAPPEKQLVEGVTGIRPTEAINGVWARPRRLVLQRPSEAVAGRLWFLLGEELWFCPARQGDFRNIDLWTADRRRGVASRWRNAGERFNRELRIREMHLSSDGSALYFHARGSTGNVDLFPTRRNPGGWSDAEPRTSLNTDADEGYPFVSEDGSELWFTRTYKGAPGIFRSLRTDVGRTEPALILSSFAGEPTLDRAGNRYFVHHFVVDGKIVEADTYVAMHR